MKKYCSVVLVLFVFFTTTAAPSPIEKRSKCAAKSVTSGSPVSLFVSGFDTVISPTITAIDSKVIASSEGHSLEITPLSSFNNGLLLEPVNHEVNTSIPATFLIRDSLSSWTFYTDSKLRMAIRGNGEVAVNSSLLIDPAVRNAKPAFRVNGRAHVDSSMVIGEFEDAGSFIAMTRNVKYVTEADDGISPYTTTPIAWAMGKDLPVFRLRHPNVVTGNPYLNSGIGKDFMILPYEFGTAIEYNGVVECWVGEWSIHKGMYYHDVEGQQNGWGGVLWVGDDVDGGGIRATARNNRHLGGEVVYGELSVEKFGRGDRSDGDFRLRLPETINSFQFVYGGRGSTNIVASLNHEGIVVPKISSVLNATAPSAGQIVFDSTQQTFKGYNGTGWADLAATNPLVTGSYIRSATGLNLVYAVPHGLSTVPAYFNVIATSPAAGGFTYVTADAGYLYVHFSTEPVAGIDNLSWNWQVKP